jgi:hypothetical protein
VEVRLPSVALTVKLDVPSAGFHQRPEIADQLGGLLPAGHLVQRITERRYQRIARCGKRPI